MRYFKTTEKSMWRYNGKVEITISKFAVQDSKNELTNEQIEERLIKNEMKCSSNSPLKFIELLGFEEMTKEQYDNYKFE